MWLLFLCQTGPKGGKAYPKAGYRLYGGLTSRSVLLAADPSRQEHAETQFLLPLGGDVALALPSKEHRPEV